MPQMSPLLWLMLLLMTSLMYFILMTILYFNFPPINKNFNTLYKNLKPSYYTFFKKW